MSQYKKNISNQEKLESPIDFRSDTVTLPSHEMLASIALLSATVNDDFLNNRALPLLVNVI